VVYGSMARPTGVRAVQVDPDRLGRRWVGTRTGKSC